MLLTGDLNRKAQQALLKEYAGREPLFECDVAKGCHHGSDDVSLRFLEAMHAAVTVISSGDNEGHAHPRPAIVAASAVTGYRHVDRQTDELLTPLVYSTEIERSVAHGAVTRIDTTAYPHDGGTIDVRVYGMAAEDVPVAFRPDANEAERAEPDALSGHAGGRAVAAAARPLAAGEPRGVGRGVRSRERAHGRQHDSVRDAQRDEERVERAHGRRALLMRAV